MGPFLAGWVVSALSAFAPAPNPLPSTPRSLSLPLSTTHLNMAWQGYIDQMLQSNTVGHAAILGTDGSIWAQSAEIGLTAE